MSCHLTEKISLLIDGELGREEAALLTEHLPGCAFCQQAREDFLHLRQQLSAIEAAPHLLIQQQETLRNILATGAHEPAKSLSSKRGKPTLLPNGLRERLANAFSTPRYSPALLSALALILVGFIGLAAYLNLRHAARDQRSTEDNRVASHNENSSNKTQGVGDGVAEVKPAPEAQKIATKGEQDDGGLLLKTRNGTGSRAVRPASASVNRTGTARIPRAPDSAPENNARTIPSQPGLNLPSTRDSSNPVVESAAVDKRGTKTRFSRMDRYSAGGPQDLTARHVEQAQLLLRAFRNARPEAQGSASDISYEKARSKKLLYQNIVLRREAASAGNLPVEKLLSRLEPILIDIANLPARPADDDVRTIKDRMQKKNIVAMLQVSLTPASRFN
jgi:hypothetical protein